MHAFTPFVGLVALAAATVLPVGTANAGDGQPSTGATPRPVLICATDAATRRAFTREHGSAPIFVTAREARSVRASEPTWSAPRCMTAREHARYRETAVNYAAVR